MRSFNLLVGPDLHFLTGVYLDASEKYKMAKFRFGTFFEINIIYLSHRLLQLMILNI